MVFFRDFRPLDAEPGSSESPPTSGKRGEPKVGVDLEPVVELGQTADHVPRSAVCEAVHCSYRYDGKMHKSAAAYMIRSRERYPGRGFPACDAACSSPEELHRTKKRRLVHLRSRLLSLRRAAALEAARARFRQTG